MAQSSKHGYACGNGFDGIVCMECLCIACNDKSTGRRKYGCRYELYDGFLFRIRSDDSDPDYSRKNVRSKIKGADNGCIKESDETCTENSGACKRWKRSNGFYRPGTKRRYFRCSSGRKYSGRWKNFRGSQCSQ